MRKTVWTEGNSVRWYDPLTNKKQRATYSTPAETRRAKAEKILELEKWRPGATRDTAPPLSVLGEYLIFLTQEKNVRPHTLIGRKRDVEYFINRPTIKMMGHCTADEINAWASEMFKRGNNSTTVHARLKNLRAFLNFAVKRRYLLVNPLDHRHPDAVALPTPKHSGHRFSEDQLRAAIEKSPDWFRPYLVIAINTAARRQELLRMEWQDIDFTTWAWHIPAHKAKTKKERTIPLLEAEQAALLSILGGKDPKKAVGPVFMKLDRQGRLVRFAEWMVQSGWMQTKKAAGIKHVAYGNRPHDLRHTFASMFQGRWDSLKRICGWETDSMRERYSHTWLSEVREDREKFGVKLGYFGGNDGEKRP